MADRIAYRVMTANHLPQQWRDALGLDGQDVVEVYENVSVLRRIEAGRASERQLRKGEDMKAKKRRGILSLDQVRNIRSEARKNMRVSQIAARYGISASTVRRIVRYETYRGDG